MKAQCKHCKGWNTGLERCGVVYCTDCFERTFLGSPSAAPDTKSQAVTESVTGKTEGREDSRPVPSNHPSEPLRATDTRDLRSGESTLQIPSLETLTQMGKTVEGVRELNEIVAEQIFKWFRINTYDTGYSYGYRWYDPYGGKNYQKQVPTFCSDRNLSASVRDRVVERVGKQAYIDSLVEVYFAVETHLTLCESWLALECSPLHEVIACLDAWREWNDRG